MIVVLTLDIVVYVYIIIYTIIDTNSIKKNPTN